MNNCTDCKHSKFDPVWGEYKCLCKECRIYILLEADECPNYEKQKKEKGEEK